MRAPALAAMALLALAAAVRAQAAPPTQPEETLDEAPKWLLEPLLDSVLSDPHPHELSGTQDSAPILGKHAATTIL